MVTFVCYYCDATLKKNQCDKHVMGRCRPAALTCIDCSKIFQGTQYKSHISCISQMDKHWGQYAPSKQANNKQNGNANANKQQTVKQQKNKKQQKQQKTQGSWNGWKNEIKKALVDQSPQQKNVQLQVLKTKNSRPQTKISNCSQKSQKNQRKQNQQHTQHQTDSKKSDSQVVLNIALPNNQQITQSIWH